MSDAANRVYETIDAQNSDESALTRRKLVGGAAATLGGLGLLGVPDLALARKRRRRKAKPKSKFHAPNDPQTILNVAASAEVLATIVNTVGPEKVPGLDPVTKRNIQAAAREELIHYNVLAKLGGKPATRSSVWIPDAVFASPTSLLNALVIGDQIFINAYMVATTAFGDAGQGKLARITSEFMGSEAVHRALARQSLGLLGNDRVFMKYTQADDANGPGGGGVGFAKITEAVTQLKSAGFNFGAPGASPGRYYDFDQTSNRTPNPQDLSARQAV
ncbi:MAG: hypothetical protein NVSMB25_15230 [Thermoleophilaceae bacterium]